jgi:hypothetical protein
MSCGLVAAGPARGIDSIEAFRVNSLTPVRCASFSDLNGTEARMSTTTDTVIAALPVATLPHPDLDRRLEVRHRCGRISVCRAYGGSRIGSLWVGPTLEISASGLSLLLYQRLAPGTNLTVEMEDAADSLCTLSCRVVWAASSKDGRWLHGCRLYRELSEAELVALAAQD